MLTLEELEELNIGTWIWIVYLKSNPVEKFYTQICTGVGGKYFIYSKPNTIFIDIFENYGKTWVAYKSKEKEEENKYSCISCIRYKRCKMRDMTSSPIPYLHNNETCHDYISKEKEKDVEDLTEELEKGKDYPYINTPRDMAERLVQVGFGDTKQAVKKAFELLKEKLPNCVDEGSEEHVLSQVEAYMEIENIIDKIYRGLYGEEIE